MPGLQESLGLNTDSLEYLVSGYSDFELPESLEITADVENFSLDSTFTVALADVLDTIDTDNITGYDDLKDALSDLADALAKFGSISWEQGMQGLGLMGSALSEIAIITAADGLLAGIAGAIGSGSLLIAIQGLGDLADAFIKFSEIPWENAQTGLATMGTALSEIAGGGLLATFSGFGASAISEMANPLGDLADSVKKWSDVTVPTGIATQLGSLASGVNGFMFAGSGADAIATVAKPIGDLANSVKKWSDVVVPQDIGTQLGSLASGVNGFMFGGMGANTSATLSEPIGKLAISVKKWSGVTVPDTL